MSMNFDNREVSLLWRARHDADMARARTLAPEELLAEIRTARRREAEQAAAVKAGRGTMGVRRSPEEGARKPPDASQSGAGGAVEGVGSIPRGEARTVM